MGFECNTDAVDRMAGALDQSNLDLFSSLGFDNFKFDAKGTGADYGRELSALQGCLQTLSSAEEKNLGFDVEEIDAEFNRVQLVDSTTTRDEAGNRTVPERSIIEFPRFE